MSIWATVASTVAADIFSANTRSKSNAAGARADKANEDALNLKQQQYDNWESVYGPIRSSLGSYYSSLEPDSFVAKQLTELQTSYDAHQVEFTRSRQQQGISEGANQALDEANKFRLAESQAGIRASGDAYVAEEQRKAFSINTRNPVNLTGQLATSAQYDLNKQARLDNQAAREAQFAGKLASNAKNEFLGGE